MKNTFFFYSSLAFGCSYNMALVADCVSVKFIVICCHILVFSGICSPPAVQWWWLEAGTHCRVTVLF